MSHITHKTFLKHRKINKQVERGLAAVAVAQLDEIFPQFEAGRHFLRASFTNWQTEAHIRCGYSYGAVQEATAVAAAGTPLLTSPSSAPSSSSSQSPSSLPQPPTTVTELHRALAAPLGGGRVLFAGEAYVSEGSANMTVHAALDAGARAAKEAATYLAAVAATSSPLSSSTCSSQGGSMETPPRRARL